MVNVAYEIERLIKFAVRKKMITVWDIIPVRNSLMAVLNVEEPFQGEVKDDARETPVEILENILDYAYEKGIIEENSEFTGYGIGQWRVAGMHDGWTDGRHHSKISF